MKCVNDLAFFNHPTTVLQLPSSNNVVLIKQLNPLILPCKIQLIASRAPNQELYPQEEKDMGSDNAKTQCGYCSVSFHLL